MINNLIRSILLLTLTSGLILSLGCDNGNDGDDPGDRGIILETKAFSFSQSLSLQFNSVRTKLIVASSNLESMNLDSSDAAQVVEDLYNSSTDLFSATGLLGENRQVIAGYPEALGELINGQDWSDRPDVNRISAEQVIGLSPVEADTSGIIAYNHYSAIVESGTFKGITFVRTKLDTLMRRATAFSATPDDTTEKTFFMLDADGTIVYDTDDTLVGKSMLDDSIFNSSQVDLCELILENSEGHSSYNSDGGPGYLDGEAERIVAWNRVTIADTYWILAVTEAY